MRGGRERKKKSEPDFYVRSLRSRFSVKNREALNSRNPMQICDLLSRYICGRDSYVVKSIEGITKMWTPHIKLIPYKSEHLLKSVPAGQIETG